MNGAIKPSFCIIYDLQAERMKRSNTSYYESLTSPFLMEAMTEFLEQNPSPVKDKKKLKEGIELMTAVAKKANTNELKEIARDYYKIYSGEYDYTYTDKKD